YADYFPTGTRTQGLEGGQVRAVAQEAHGAVNEGEVGPAGMAAAEGAQPVMKRHIVASGRRWELVVDRHGGAERAMHPGCVREGLPPVPPLGNGLHVVCTAAVEFRVPVIAFPKQERNTGAVGDVGDANVAVGEKDAVVCGGIRDSRVVVTPSASVAAIA